MVINWKASTEHVCMKRKKISIKKIQVSMVIMESKILRACLKRNKNHVMVMFVWLNVVNTYSVQGMNTHAHQSLRPSVICNGLLQIKSLIINAWYNILMFIINNRKDVPMIRNRELHNFSIL